jgi:hypothetical protein
MLCPKSIRCPVAGVGPRLVRASPVLGTGALLKRHLVQAAAQRESLPVADVVEQQTSQNGTKVSMAPATAAWSRLQTLTLQQVDSEPAYTVMAAAHPGHHRPNMSLANVLCDSCCTRAVHSYARSCCAGQLSHVTLATSLMWPLPLLAVASMRLQLTCMSSTMVWRACLCFGSYDMLLMTCVARHLCCTCLDACRNMAISATIR